MLHLAAQIDESAAYVRGRWGSTPRCGIILGSGLGSVGEAIELEQAIDYGDVPNFLKSTAVGHRGRLLCGKLQSVPVIAMRQNGLDYFDIHHTADDTFDKIDRAELDQNIAAWAAMAYLAAQSDLDFRKLAAHAQR